MAYTDALSIAAKALGVGADIWFANDRSKYEQQDKWDDLEDPDDWTDVFTAMGDASTVEELQAIFGDAWKKANQKDRPSIKKEYDRLKAILEKKQ